MTDQRSDETIPEPVADGASEQVPMDDAAGGPQADKSDELDPEQAPDEEEAAAALGDFA